MMVMATKVLAGWTKVITASQKAWLDVQDKVAKNQPVTANDLVNGWVKVAYTAMDEWDQWVPRSPRGAGVVHLKDPLTNVDLDVPAGTADVVGTLLAVERSGNGTIVHDATVTGAVSAGGPVTLMLSATSSAKVTYTGVLAARDAAKADLGPVGYAVFRKV